MCYISLPGKKNDLQKKKKWISIWFKLGETEILAFLSSKSNGNSTCLLYKSPAHFFYMSPERTVQLAWKSDNSLVQLNI